METAADRQGLSCNLELKARLASATTAHQVAQELSTRTPRREIQSDTYFGCAHGRLKLRQIDQQRGQLIWYQRADRAEARESHYQLTEITAFKAVCETLSAALGVRAKVAKERTVYWFENVRIHVDEVASLGTFLEFEAVITSPSEEAAAASQLEFLSAAFKIPANDVLTMSYGDMVGPSGDMVGPSGDMVGSAEKLTQENVETASHERR